MHMNHLTSDHVGMNLKKKKKKENRSGLQVETTNEIKVKITLFIVST